MVGGGGAVTDVKQRKVEERGRNRGRGNLTKKNVPL